ncbi:hypothetical protein SBV1_1160020 [Verrucomicrobia bacterium]|nr:hypothetical protein SBV1_1160020 [Verrucomicrobiota bacterium]
MHYNVEGRQLFGVRWQSAAERSGDTPLGGATGHSRMVVVYPMDSSVGGREKAPYAPTYARVIMLYETV